MKLTDEQKEQHSKQLGEEISKTIQRYVMEHELLDLKEECGCEAAEITHHALAISLGYFYSESAEEVQMWQNLNLLNMIVPEIYQQFSDMDEEEDEGGNEDEKISA